jgi:hypothetical protein
MISNVISLDLSVSMKYRLVYLLFLAVFAISPIADAYSDSLCSPPVFLNDLDDSDSPVSINELKLNDTRKSLHALKTLKHASRHYHARMQQALIHGCPACQIIKIQISANDVKSSQNCPPLASDPSPPVI